MAKIDILKEIRDPSEFADFAMRGFPNGYLYDHDSVKRLIKVFTSLHRNFLLTIEKAANDLFTINEGNLFLNEYLTMYGLPNVIFPNLSLPDEKVFAINMMRLSRELISKEEFESFMLLLGYNVKFYLLNETVLEYASFPYSFPVSFSASVTKKDKLTYWIWIEENSSQTSDFYNLGDAFDLDFAESDNKLTQAKKILDFLKPDYLKFQYISTYTKNYYGL